MLKKRIFTYNTCFSLGIAGAVVTLVHGLLYSVWNVSAPWAQMSTLALMGGMILFLGLVEKGEEKRKLRGKLFLLFFVLLLANLNLPPLDWFWLVVTPGVFALYRRKGDVIWIAILLIGEIISAVARTLAIVNYFEENTFRVLGVALIITSVTRFMACFILLRRSKTFPKSDTENVSRLQ